AYGLLIQHLMCVEVIVPEALIFDAADDSGLFTPNEHLRRDFNERLRICREVLQAFALRKHALNGSSSKSSALLEFRKNVGEIDAGLIESDGRCALSFRRLDTRAADREVRDSPLQSRSRNGPCVVQCLDARLDQMLVVKPHSVRSLVLDAVPNCLEVGALQNGAPWFDRPALVGVPDLKTARDLPKHRRDGAELIRGGLRNGERPIADRESQ
ncbi:MAG: hypothetical protein ACREJX_19955, partial [Polyangiaceae bacterium]